MSNFWFTFNVTDWLSYAWKICILQKQATEVIVIGWFGNGKCQSIVSPCPLECNFQSETKIEPDLRLKFDRWVQAENSCSILKLVYFDSWNWQSFVSTCDVFNCLFPLNVQNEFQLLSRVFCHSWLVCLLGFLVVKYVACQSGKSDFGWHCFHLAWCVRGLKSLKRFWRYLIVFSASRMVSLSNYCIWCLFFISNLMKPSVVYAAIYFMHVWMIWDNDL